MKCFANRIKRGEWLKCIDLNFNSVTQMNDMGLTTLASSLPTNLEVLKFDQYSCTNVADQDIEAFASSLPDVIPSEHDEGHFNYVKACFPWGARFEIPETERRGMSVVQLEKVIAFVKEQSRRWRGIAPYKIEYFSFNRSRMGG